MISGIYDDGKQNYRRKKLSFRPLSRSLSDVTDIGVGSDFGDDGGVRILCFALAVVVVVSAFRVTCVFRCLFVWRTSTWYWSVWRIYAYGLL